MHLAIVGSRSFTDYAMLEEIVDEILKDNPEMTIVSGGASGADSLGAIYAVKHGLPLIEFIPDWKGGRSAGMLRNIKIIEKSDHVLAFWDGSSPGSKHSIGIAEKLHRPLRVVIFEPVVPEWDGKPIPVGILKVSVDPRSSK